MNKRLPFPEKSSKDLFTENVRRRAWFNHLLVVTNRDTGSLKVINSKDEVLFESERGSYVQVSFFLNRVDNPEGIDSGWKLGTLS